MLFEADVIFLHYLKFLVMWFHPLVGFTIICYSGDLLNMEENEVFLLPQM